MATVSSFKALATIVRSGFRSFADKQTNTLVGVGVQTRYETLRALDACCAEVDARVASPVTIKTSG